MREDRVSISARAKDISEFLGHDLSYVYDRLAKGFHHNHKLVADDFNTNKTDVNDEDSLRQWYLDTDAYIYELSAYHMEEGFNYTGMCEGICDNLKSKGASSALVLGDGIGDLSLDLWDRGLKATYNDLEGSKTSDFALFRIDKYADGGIDTILSDSWDPPFIDSKFDAIIALDFFEHLVNVDEWVEACYGSLNTPGWFMAQNAFAIGDAENGNSIPMHLSVNNKYQFEWTATLEQVGFTHELAEWWRK